MALLVETPRVNRLRRLGGERRQAGDLGDAERAYGGRWRSPSGSCRPTTSRRRRVRNDLGVLLKYTGGFPEAAALYERAHAVLVAGWVGAPGRRDGPAQHRRPGARRRATRRRRTRGSPAVTIREASARRRPSRHRRRPRRAGRHPRRHRRHDEAAELLEGALAGLRARARPRPSRSRRDPREPRRHRRPPRRPRLRRAAPAPSAGDQGTHPRQDNIPSSYPRSARSASSVAATETTPKPESSTTRARAARAAGTQRASPHDHDQDQPGKTRRPTTSRQRATRRHRPPAMPVLADRR